MSKAFELLRLTDVDDDDAATGTDGMLDDHALFEDADEDDGIEINQVIDRHCLARLSCFAHSLQLAIKDAMAKCTTVRSIMAKCCKLANLCHQSAIFWGQFESKFGQGRSVPSTNATRWSSLYQQYSS